MMMASMMGAIAFQKDLGAVHSCAHALGAVCDLHHGLANALMIEPVMRFNQEAVPEKFAELAHVVGARRRARRSCPGCATLKRAIGITGRPGARRRQARADSAAGGHRRRTTSATRPIRGRARARISSASSSEAM